MRHAALLKLVIRNNRPPPVQTWTCHTSSKYSQSHTTYTHQVWFTVHSMCTHTHILPSLLQEQIHKIRSPVHTMYTHPYAHMHSSTHTHTIPTPSESFTKFNHQSHSMYAHRMHTHTHTHTQSPLQQEQIHKIISPVHIMYTHTYMHLHTHTHTLPYLHQRHSQN